MGHPSRLLKVVMSISWILMFCLSVSMPSQAQSGTVQIIVSRDKDSLVVYVPSNGTVSLQGLQFEVTDNQKNRYAYPLETYPAFFGLNFAYLATPICLRLIRQGTAVPFPIECQNLLPSQRLSQLLIDADIFWYDPDAGQGKLLTITRSTVEPNICPPQQARCTMEVPNQNIPIVATPTLISLPKVDIPVLGGGSGKLAFVSNRDGSNKWNIFLMNSDGTDVQRLTDDGNFKSVLSWSPDGQYLAYGSNFEGNWEIYVLDINANAHIDLTNHKRTDYHPAWSPDGTRIAFSSDRDSGLEIYVMNSDGTNVMRLTDSQGSNTYPAWSPDGKFIAFTSTRDQKQQHVYIMNADGSNTRQVSTGTDNFAPSWSRLGNQLAFTAGTATVASVWLIDINGDGLHGLTSEPGFSGYAVWSPDGNYIAFGQKYQGVSDIYIISADKSGRKNLTNTNDDLDAFPAWKP